jgi:hypothetical protein
MKERGKGDERIKNQTPEKQHSESKTIFFSNDCLLKIFIKKTICTVSNRAPSELSKPVLLDLPGICI